MAFAMAALSIALVVAFAASRAVAAPYAAMVMDARSGEVLHARNHDTRLHPASLTKMMTLYVAFEAIRNGEITLDTMVTVSRRAAAEPPSRLGLRPGQRIALRYLIRAAALRSGNDAATAIAEAVSGSVEAFTARMNATARAIGMENTNFLNAHGLTQQGHYSTARDMTLLGRQLYFDYPQYYNLFSRRSEDAGVARVRNTNSRFLDGYRGADGIKTGYTRAAGFNLTASAERDGVRIIVTVFGGRSVADRHERIVRLMNMGFDRAPSRVAVRRPARPQYAAGTASSPGAGRVVRLRPAPSRSLFPQRRPPREGELPQDDPLLAALREEVDAVLAEAVEEIAMHDAPPAPEASPVPPARPEDALAAAEEEPPLATRGTSAPAAEAQGTLGESVEEALALAALESPASRPESAPGAATDQQAAPQSTRAPDTLADGALPEIVLPGDVATAIPPPLETLPTTPPPPQRFAHSAEDLGPVTLRDGLVVVPGLPPIALADADALHDAAARPARDSAQQTAPQTAPQTVTQTVTQAARHGAGAPAAPLALGSPAQRLERSLSAQSTFLIPQTRQGADSDSPGIGEGIVLTASDSEPAPASQQSETPQRLVVRAALSGTGQWTVRLGDYPSRFDAERSLLRIVLAENAALGMGERRIGQRAGRFVADIGNLTHEQAERACQRLSARAQPCEIIAP